MKFRFNERKAGQAAAYLLWLRGGSKSHGCLVKMLYLADRVALIETGTPITGDTMFSMPHGPVLSKTMDACKGQMGLGHEFAEYVARGRHGLSLRSPDFDTELLSDYELSVLEKIDAEVGSWTFSQLRDYTHKELREYVQVPEGSRKLIAPEDVLRAAGLSSDVIAEFAVQADAINSLALRSDFNP